MRSLNIHKFPLLPRKKNTSKVDYGHVLIVAGSGSMTGAPILAAGAALASGSGLATLAVPKSLMKLARKAPLELMWLALPETLAKSVSIAAFKSISKFIQQRKINSLLIGPGLGTNTQTQRLVRDLVKKVDLVTVLDADGINSFKGKTKELSDHAGPLIMTPHVGEFERVFGQRCPNNLTQRTMLAKKLSRFYDVVLVIKGYRTLVVYHDKVYTNRTGNPGMAKGGTGDVLAGVIAAFVAQGLDPYSAAKWGVYCHGLAGDIAVKEKSELALVASDLIDTLPKVFLKK